MSCAPDEAVCDHDESAAMPLAPSDVAQLIASIPVDVEDARMQRRVALGVVTSRRTHGARLFFTTLRLFEPTIGVNAIASVGTDGSRLDSATADETDIQLVFSRRAYAEPSDLRWAALGNLMKPGAILRAEGAVSRDRLGRLSIGVRNADIVRVTPDAFTVARTLQLVQSGVMSPVDAASALQIDGTRLTGALALLAQCSVGANGSGDFFTEGDSTDGLDATMSGAADGPPTERDGMPPPQLDDGSASHASLHVEAKPPPWLVPREVDASVHRRRRKNPTPPEKAGKATSTGANEVGATMDAGHILKEAAAHAQPEGMPVRVESVPTMDTATSVHQRRCVWLFRREAIALSRHLSGLPELRLPANKPYVLSAVDAALLDAVELELGHDLMQPVYINCEPNVEPATVSGAAASREQALASMEPAHCIQHGATLGRFPDAWESAFNRCSSGRPVATNDPGGRDAEGSAFVCFEPGAAGRWIPPAFDVEQLMQQVPLPGCSNSLSTVEATASVCGLSEEDIARREAYVRDKKGPQVRWMVTAIQRLIRDDAPPEGCEGATTLNPVHIVDVGGGRGDLAIAVAGAFPAWRVTVVDINATSLAAGSARAAAEGLQNIRFIRCGVEDVMTALSTCDTRDKWPRPSACVGLHACGALSDAIIALAVETRCHFLVVPCCFTKHTHLRTDAGANVVPSAHEWATSLPDVPTLNGRCNTLRDALCRLAESGSGGDASKRAMLVIASLRLRHAVAIAALTHHASLQAALLAFNVTFSSKNLVLVGRQRRVASVL